jgi:hypothetical protein
MKDQLTRSKAFERSIFNTTPLDHRDIRLCRTSCATPIASCIFLPFRKPNCSFEITSKSMGLRCLDMSFATILYIQLHNEIDRKSSKERGSSC